MPFTLWLALAANRGWAAPGAGGAVGTAAPEPDGRARRIAIMRFTGPGAELIRAATGDALAENFNFTLVSIGLIETQLNLPGDVLSTVAELARRLNLSAVVRGRVERFGKGRRVTLTVVTGADGAVLGQVTFRGKTALALHEQVRTGALAQLGPLLERTAPPRPPALQGTAEESPPHPPVERPAPAAERPARPTPAAVAPPAVTTQTPADAETDAALRAADEPAPPFRRRRSSAGGGPRCEIVELEALGGVALRRFDYRDEKRGALRAFVLRDAPAGRVEATFYPIGGPRCRAGMSFGLRGAYELMAPLVAHVADRSLDSSAFAYQGELVLRIARGPFTFKPAAGFYARRFVVKGDVVPSVDYRALGGGIEIAARTRSVSFELGLGARRVLGAGELTGADWFPQATGMNWAARARAGIVVTDWLDFVVGASVEYVSLRLNTTEFGAYPNGVAAGAYDVFFLGSAGLRVRWPGMPEDNSASTAP